MVTVFRELRAGLTEDGRTKLKSPTGTLSTAEAISVVTNGLALAAHFGDGVLRAADVAAGIVGAVVKDPVADGGGLAGVPGDGRPRARRLARLLPRRRAMPDAAIYGDPPPRPGLGPGGGARRWTRSAPGRAADRGPAGGRRRWCRWVADERPGAAGGAARLRARTTRGRAAFWPFAVFSPEWQAIRWAVRARRAGALLRPARPPTALAGAPTRTAGPASRPPRQDGAPTADAGRAAAVPRPSGRCGRRCRTCRAPVRSDRRARRGGRLRRPRALVGGRRRAPAAVPAFEADRARRWRRIRDEPPPEDPRATWCARRTCATVLREVRRTHERHRRGLRGLARARADRARSPRQGRRRAAQGAAEGQGRVHLGAVDVRAAGRPGPATARGSARRAGTTTCSPRPTRWSPRWLVDAAGVLRDEDVPTSSAHVIEAVRLAEALATLRGRPLAGLAEVTEAAGRCCATATTLRLELIGRAAGRRRAARRGADDMPAVPLARDLAAQQRAAAAQAGGAGTRRSTSTCASDIDLGRSRLLHRLRLLGVPWGEPATRPSRHRHVPGAVAAALAAGVRGQPGRGQRVGHHRGRRGDRQGDRRRARRPTRSPR